MRRVEKPWGFENIWAENKKYVGKFMFIKPNNRMSLQYHNIKEETVYVQSGILRIWHSENDDDYTDLSPGDIFHVKPKTIHRFGAISDPVHLIEISTPEIDDVVRIKDDYDR